MSAAMQAQPASSNATIWIGRVISAIPALMLTMSAVMKFARPPMVLEGLTHMGWPESALFTLGVVELACVIVYLVPQSAVLGAILITGYLGGAAATHVRIGESWIMPVLLGALAWLGLFLRDARIRALVPWRSA